MAVPPPVPSIADANRASTWTITSSTTTFPIAWPVFGDGSDLDVYVNGVLQSTAAYTFQSASGLALAQIPLPITDGLVVLDTPIVSGVVEIYGQWRPRQGVLDTSPSLNRREYQQDLGQVVASLREMWGAIWSTFPLSKTGRANTYLGFDASGNPTAISFVSSGLATISAAMASFVAASTYAAGLTILGVSSYFQTLIGATSAAGLLTSLGITTFMQGVNAAATAAAARTALGLTTVGSALATAASAGAALTTLGLSAFFQTLVGSANAGALLTAQGVSTFVQSLLGATTGGQLFNLTGLGVSHRQTVKGGPVASSGLPAFLPATSVILSITSQGVSSSTPLVVTAANGVAAGGRNDLIGIATANLVWGSLIANQTNYLYVTVNADGTLTPGSTIIPPVYAWGGTPAVTAGLFTFLIGSMQGFLGNGTTAPQAFVVFVGEAVTDATTVTATVAYAYNARALSPLTAIPGAGAQASFAHNLGVPPWAMKLDLRLVNVTPEAGYSAGAELAFESGGGIGSLAALDIHNAAFSTLAAVAISAAPLGGGAAVTLTNADWNLRLAATRAF